MKEYIVDYPQYDHLSIHEFVLSFKEEITRCRDCIQYSLDDFDYAWCSYVGSAVQDDDFCAWGERVD